MSECLFYVRIWDVHDSTTNVEVVLLSMQGQKALKFHEKILFWVPKKVLQVWNNMRVTK